MSPDGGFSNGVRREKVDQLYSEILNKRRRHRNLMLLLQAAMWGMIPAMIAFYTLFGHDMLMGPISVVHERYVTDERGLINQALVFHPGETLMIVAKVTRFRDCTRKHHRVMIAPNGRHYTVPSQGNVTKLNETTVVRTPWRFPADAAVGEWVYKHQLVSVCLLVPHTRVSRDIRIRVTTKTARLNAAP
jgi:hypothetical protein